MNFNRINLNGNKITVIRQEGDSDPVFQKKVNDFLDHQQDIINGLDVHVDPNNSTLIAIILHA